MRLYLGILPLLIRFSAPAAEAHAQAAPTPDAVAIAKQLRTTGDPGPSLKVLTGRLRTLSERQVDAVADSLASFAISFPGDKSSNRVSRGVAIGTLLRSGTATDAVPYVGAAAHLLRIAERATDVPDRASAIFALTQLPDKGKSVRLLRDIASSTNPAAFVAVQELAGELAALGGLETLRELDRSGLVSERNARAELEWLRTSMDGASRNGGKPHP
jgi:hypothetical protein